MSLGLATPPDASLQSDRVVVIGGGRATLDLLRFATLRSDDVALFGDGIDAPAARYATRFAVQRQSRPAEAADLAAAAAVLVSLDDLDSENTLVQAARRARVPVHVSGRALVSDFTMLEFLERGPAAPAG